MSFKAYRNLALAAATILGLSACASVPLTLKKPLSKQARIGIASQLGKPLFVSSETRRSKNESGLVKFLTYGAGGELDSFIHAVPKYNLDNNIENAIVKAMKVKGYRHVFALDGNATLNDMIAKYKLNDIIFVDNSSAEAPAEDGSVTSFDETQGGNELKGYGIYYATKTLFVKAYTSTFSSFYESVYSADNLKKAIAASPAVMNGKLISQVPFPGDFARVSPGHLTDLAKWLDSTVVPATATSSLQLIGVEKAPEKSWF